jgi:hypothetical protein
MIQHIKIKNCKYKSHTEAAKKIRESSHNTITLEDGQTLHVTLQKHSFSETFPHLVDLLYLSTAGLSQALMEEEEFRECVCGYDARASFVDYRTMHQSQ